MIGTTDVAYEGDPADVAIDASEVGYLCDVVNRSFVSDIGPDDVVWSYSGVRPLYDDGADNPSAVTRDYVLELDGDDDRAPLLSVFGGKITTYRRLAEHAMEKLLPALGYSSRGWTAQAPLPGGDIANADFMGFLSQLKSQFPWLPQSLTQRWARAYGTRAIKFIGSATTLEGLGEDFGNNVFEAEIRYLIDQEWARTADDVLWRRSKLGLHVSDATKAKLADYIDRQTGAKPSAVPAAGIASS